MSNVSVQFDTDSGLESKKLSTASKTIASGKTLFVPYLEIASGHTYTVSSNAALISVSTLTVSGTLINSGEVITL